MPEAPIERTEHGLVPKGEGWFVLNARDVPWAHTEGEERPLRPWDYFHCPPDTPHVLVATGTEPFVYIAAGRRRPEDEQPRLVYPVDDTARRYGASVEEETREPGAAYEGVELREGSYRDGDLPDYVNRSTR